jgi:hypothetical protein
MAVPGMALANGSQNGNGNQNQFQSLNPTDSGAGANSQSPNIRPVDAAGGNGNKMQNQGTPPKDPSQAAPNGETRRWRHRHLPGFFDQCALSLLMKYQRDNVIVLVLASVTGQTPEKILDLLEEYRGIGPILARYEVDREAFKAAMQAAVRILLDLAQQAGLVTSQQVSDILALLEDNASTTDSAACQRPQGLPRGPLSLLMKYQVYNILLAALETVTGEDSEILQDLLQGRHNLEEILESYEVDRETFRNALATIVADLAGKALDVELITQPQYEAILDRLANGPCLSDEEGFSF